MQYVSRICSAKLHVAPANMKSRSGIDQANVNERNHQVGFMDQIYSNARSVRICIEDRSLTASVADYHRLFHWLRCGGSHSDAIVVSLRRLLSLRYFGRVWVIQEVALAQEVCLHVNEHVLLFDSTVMGRIERLCKQYCLGVPSVLKWSACRTIEAGIAACLLAAMDCGATDPRDEVYAVLSLMEPQARSLIPVDYSLNVDAVWSNAIAAIIVSQGNLDILSHVGLHHRILGYTSRQPFMGRKDLAAYLARLAASNPLHLTLPWSEGRRASPWRAEIVVSSSDHMNTLQQSDTFSVIGWPLHSSLLPRFCVRAHYIDRIETKDIYMYRSNSYDRDQMRYSWERTPFDRIKSKSIEKIARFFKADMDNVSTTGTCEPSHTTSGFHSGTVTPLADIRKAFVKNDPTIEVTDLSVFIDVCKKSRNGRPLFTSCFSVGFLGTGSSTERGEEFEFGPNDQIFAIDGARTTFVLRESDHIHGNYEIVDECYLWAALELDCWNPGTKKGRWGQGVKRPTTAQTRMINIR